MTVQAAALQPGMVIDYSPYSTWGDEWEAALVAAPPVLVKPGLVEISFVGGPPPLRLAGDWPVTLDTPEMADLRAALVMEESERHLEGRR